MEFVLTNGVGAWDNPGGVSGANYTVACGGTYRLAASSLLLLPPALPCLLVSDLDGTMVGDEQALRAFSSYWGSTASVVGSKLVYSTGRALASFLVLSAPGGAGAHLPRPDVLICAVGTKVYLPVLGGRGVAAMWVEDGGWRGQLDHGWDLSLLRALASESISTVGQSVAHFRPPEEQNEHKLTLGVREGAPQQQLVALLREGAQAAGLTPRLIVSGTGGWVYVDIVPAAAGKQQSLEYVRSLLGFEGRATVCAGDSGNDIDMLGGENSRGVVVGNAQPDLVEWAAAQGGGGGEEGGKEGGRLYVAKAGHAWGVIEGLQHFGMA